VSFLSGGVRLTDQELEEWAGSIAVQIKAPRERPIGILAPSSLEFVAALRGIWGAGAIAVPLNPNHPLAELEYIVEDSGLEEFYFHESCAELASSLKAHGIKIARGKGEATGNPEPEDAALMIYTSGTTSRPKGVISTYGSLYAQVASLTEAWNWSQSDRTLCVLPLHHVHGLVNIITCGMQAGAEIELADKFDAALVWERIASGKINVFMAVPTIYVKLLEHWEKSPEKEKWSAAAKKMRLMVSGSAALPAPLSDRWFAATGHRLLERYGMTEIGMALSNPLEGERRVGTVGKPLPGVRVRLVEGEIQVKGETVFREYWEREVDCFTKDGWFRTGDIAELDEKGYYKILGRASQDILKSGGYKISALEIESALLEHPAVNEVAVVGVPCEMYGEKVAAVYVGEDADLAAWLKGRLSSYKVPTVWKLVESLPRNAMGKVLKPEVKKLLADDVGLQQAGTVFKPR
jgi:malonyl-CoA/methylmalonyl-CoA synthetase